MKTRRPSDDRENLSSKAYNHILRQITQGGLAPGTRVKERDLAAELGCSHLPIREAITKLVQVGWLEQEPRKGARVRFVDRPRIRSLWDFREILEVGAVDLIFSSYREKNFARLQAEEAKLNESYRNRDASGYMRHDESFHLELVSLSGNEGLCQTHKSIFKQAVHAYPGFMMGAITLTFSDPVAPLHEVEPFSHSDVLRHLLSGNQEETKNLLRNHIKNGARYFCRIGEG